MPGGHLQEVVECETVALVVRRVRDMIEQPCGHCSAAEILHIKGNVTVIPTCILL